MESYDVDENYGTAEGVGPEAFIVTDVKGVSKKVVPATPAVVLTNPKFPHNIGQTIRALSCFDVKQLWWTGERMLKTLEGLSRIPREERMRGYAEVAVLHHERPVEIFSKIAVPVAVEFRENAENLVEFVHPPNAVYIFGPEDGSIDQGTLRHCHRFVKIPTKHCTNLSAAVYLVLYDRLSKQLVKEA